VVGANNKATATAAVKTTLAAAVVKGQKPWSSSSGPWCRAWGFSETSASPPMVARTCWRGQHGVARAAATAAAAGVQAIPSVGPGHAGQYLDIARPSGRRTGPCERFCDIAWLATHLSARAAPEADHWAM